MTGLARIYILLEEPVAIPADMAWYPITVNQEPVESVFEFKTTCLEPLSDFLSPPTLYHRAPLLSRLSGVDTTEGGVGNGDLG